MPGRDVNPRFMQRCVADVTATGKELGSAFAICTAQSQKSGYTKKGSSKMTGKGAARERAFKNAPDMDQKNADYERAVQAGRQQEEISMRSIIRQLEEGSKDRPRHREILSEIKAMELEVQRMAERISEDGDEKLAGYAMEAAGMLGKAWVRMAFFVKSAAGKTIRSEETDADDGVLDERFGRRQSYSRDPYLTKAKTAGVDAKGLAYKKGDEVMIYKDGATYAGANKDQAWRDFQAAKDDEAFMSGGY